MSNQHQVPPLKTLKLTLIPGAKSIVQTFHKTEATLTSYAQQLKSSAPDFEPNQTIEWLRSNTKAYAAIIPGASGYIDSAFNDIDAVRRKHGPEVDSILKDAYNELKEISSKEGMTFTSAQTSWEALQKYLKRIADLSGDVGQEILENHPALKDKVGGNMDQLRQMGEKYGPEAKNQVEETVNQIKEIMNKGMRADSIPKVQALLQEKVRMIQEAGGKAWEEGMEKAKPLLDKSPQVKQLVEQNWQALKESGDVQGLYQKIQDAVSSGDAGSLRKYIDRVSQGRSGGDNSALEDYMKMISSGSQILPKLNQMRQLAQERGEEAEKIAKDTLKEIEEILQRRVGDVQKLVKKS